MIRIIAHCPSKVQSEYGVAQPKNSTIAVKRNGYSLTVKIQDVQLGDGVMPDDSNDEYVVTSVEPVRYTS